ncbi:uncharacterized protein BJ212DRAFT_1487989 [Suillus subaureus]|uniref:Uncharacterized protein n=1 Tax=Suillus subaureus TaxID=48587 RepID=A0A9P7DQJ9_9AGAM|nr:uncharacterized protein BJ212DRAFT_1487989 [Suillus subaureus]KAG1800509.1 hypothetical protein BJ212DRAFT_1487989 [Suillus subaureus]
MEHGSGLWDMTPTFTTALDTSELIKNKDEKQVVKAIYSIFSESFVCMVHQCRFKWERVHLPESMLESLNKIEPIGKPSAKDLAGSSYIFPNPLHSTVNMQTSNSSMCLSTWFKDWCDSITSDGLSMHLSTMTFASTTCSSLHLHSDDDDNNTAELTLLSKPVVHDTCNIHILNPVKSEVHIPSPAPLTGPTQCKYPPFKSKAPSPPPFIISPHSPPLKYPASLHTPLAPISPTPSSQQGKIPSRLPSPPPFVISPRSPPLKYPASLYTLLPPVSPTALSQQGKILSRLPSPPPFIISPNLPPLKYSVSLCPLPSLTSQSLQCPSPLKKKTSSGHSIPESKAVSVPSSCDFQLSPSTPHGVDGSSDPQLPSSDSGLNAKKHHSNPVQIQIQNAPSNSL